MNAPGIFEPFRCGTRLEHGEDCGKTLMEIDYTAHRIRKRCPRCRDMIVINLDACYTEPTNSLSAPARASTGAPGGPERIIS